MEKRIKYSVPFNRDLDLIKWAITSGEVYEVYFSGALDHDFSCKNEGMGPNSNREIGALIELCAEQGIGRNLLMNKSILYFDNVKTIFSYIKSLEKFGGITTITVADPAIVSYIGKVFPNLRIQSSVFMHIDTANKVREGWKMGIKTFCLDVSVNRNGPELEKIRDLKPHYDGMAIKLLVNHGCFDHCFFSVFHHEWGVLQGLQPDSGENNKYMLGNMVGEKTDCIYKSTRQDDWIKRPFIRPEDIGYYENEGLMDYAKICHRIDPSPVLRTKMESYFKRRCTKDLCDVIPTYRYNSDICLNEKFPDSFVEKVLYCGQTCETCNYCETVAQKVLRKKPPKLSKLK